MKHLKDLFLGELADLYNAEIRVAKALPALASAATCADLTRAIHAHLKQTEGHLDKIVQIFESFGEAARANKCSATAGMFDAADRIATDYKGSRAINAALVASLQKTNHYAIAAYGCLHEWAILLGNQRAADLLRVILIDEKSTNEMLTQIARTTCNKQALGNTRNRPLNETAESKHVVASSAQRELVGAH